MSPMPPSEAPLAAHSIRPTADGNRWRSRLVIALATVHAVKLISSILPEAWRPDLLPFGLSNAYEKLTGSKQCWNMFETIPSHHRFSARLVLIGTDGVERTLGPLLPGFQAWPNPEIVRIESMYDRLFPSGIAPALREAWLREADAQLRASNQLKPGESWCLEILEDYTRHLFHIRRDGNLFQRKTTRYSPACPEGTPHPPPET